MTVACVNYNPAGANPDSVVRLKEEAFRLAGFDGRPDVSFSYECPTGNQLRFLDAWVLTRLRDSGGSLTLIFLGLGDLAGTGQAACRLADRWEAMGVTVRIAASGADRGWDTVRDALARTFRKPRGGTRSTASPVYRKQLGENTIEAILKVRQMRPDEGSDRFVRATDIARELGCTVSTVTTVLANRHAEPAPKRPSDAYAICGRIPDEGRELLRRAVEADLEADLALARIYDDYEKKGPSR